MKFFCLITFIILFYYGMPSAESSDGETSILLVSDANDATRLLEWREKMSISDILAIHDIGAFTDIIYLIFDGKLLCIQFSKKPDLNKMIVSPGSVVIYGHLTKQREGILRKNPALDRVFKTLPEQNYFDL